MNTIVKLEREYEIEDIDPDVIIDAIGLNCPTHVMKTKSELVKMSNRQIAQFISKDKSCILMVEKLVRSLYGYEVLTQYEEDGKFVFMILKDSRNVY